MNAARQRQIALHALLVQQVAVKLRVFQRQRHVIGNRAQQIFIRASKRPRFFVQQLQHADGFAAFAADRQAQQRLGAEAQPHVHFGFKARIRVSVWQVHRLAVFRHPAGNAAT